MWPLNFTQPWSHTNDVCQRRYRTRLLLHQNSELCRTHTAHSEERELVKKGTVVRYTSANSTRWVTAYQTLHWELSVVKLTCRPFQGAAAEASETARNLNYCTPLCSAMQLGWCNLASFPDCMNYSSGFLMAANQVKTEELFLLCL